MQTDQQQLLQNIKIPLAAQVGIPNPPITSLFGQNVDFQPSKICPRNFIIFDRTDNRSQIMYHPASCLGFGYRGLNEGTTYVENKIPIRNDVNAPKEIHSVLKEDSADIDLLLSFEEGDDEDDGEEEEDEEEVSTARTHGNDANDTADSCSSKLKQSSLAVSTFSHKSSGSSEKKREKMRKMVNSLRGIVPGGNRLNTVAVIDEAVNYLKSLKVELQKLDIVNLTS